MASGTVNPAPATNGFQYQGTRNVNNWYPKLTSDPAFMNMVKARYQQLRGNLLSDASIKQRIDTLIAPLTPTVVARDYAKWPVTTVLPNGRNGNRLRSRGRHLGGTGPGDARLHHRAPRLDGHAAPVTRAQGRQRLVVRSGASEPASPAGSGIPSSDAAVRAKAANDVGAVRVAPAGTRPGARTTSGTARSYR